MSSVRVGNKKDGLWRSLTLVDYSWL